MTVQHSRWEPLLLFVRNSLTKELGLRKATPESTNISRANSVKGDVGEPLRKCNELQEADKHDENEVVRVLGPGGEERITYEDANHERGRRQRGHNSGKEL